MKRFSALVLSVVAASCSGARQEPVATGEAAGRPTADAGAPEAGALPSSAGADALEGSLSSRESKAVARALARVSALRGLRATQPVPGVKLGRDQLVARVKDKALREYPPEALRREGQLLQLFGFAPPTFDYLGEMMTLLEAQL